MTSAKHLSSVVSLLLAVGALSYPSFALAGQGLEIAGPEIWVTGPETVPISGADDFPDVGVDEAGRRIYVWTLFGVDGGIALRRFGDDGNPLEDPRVINTTDAANEDRPRVAVAADGSFLVIWQSNEDDGGSNKRWVRCRAFGSNGVAMGPDFLASSESSDTAALIGFDVAALRRSDGTSGGFVVVWESFNGQSDSSGSSIQARLISAAGVPTLNQIEVNAITGGSQRKPTVTELADGGFFVVWIEPDLQGRRFSDVGAAAGDQFTVNTQFSGVHDVPDTAVGWNGVVAVVWEDLDDPGNGNEIRARLFDSELTPKGPDFRVNTVVEDAQDFPRLGDYGPKGFLVTWESLRASPGGDLADESVQARIVTGQDTFDGPQIQYNVWETNNQTRPASHGWYGRLASAWRSVGNDQDQQAPFEDHITGRQIEHCLFCDDFEWFHPGSTGSLWRWTASLGAAGQ